MLALDKTILFSPETLEALKVIETRLVTARDGKVYTMRQLRPGDFELVRRFLKGLSQRTNLLRYFIPVPELPDELIREDILRLSRPNPANQITLMLTDQNEAGAEIIVGIAELARDKSLPADRYEVGIVMDDQYQGRGLGLLLLNGLLEIARRRGVKKVQAIMLAENRAVRKLLLKLDVPAKFSTSQGETFWEATL